MDAGVGGDHGSASAVSLLSGAMETSGTYPPGGKGIGVTGEGKLCFEELGYPLSEMADNGDGTVQADSGASVELGEFDVYFGPGFTEESMVAALEDAGFEFAHAYWHKHLDTGQADVLVPEGMTAERAASEVLKIEGVTKVCHCNRAKRGIAIFEGSERLSAADTPEGSGNRDVIPIPSLGECPLAWYGFEVADPEDGGPGEDEEGL